MLEAFPSRQEFTAVLEEVRALRADFRRHAEETAARFAALERELEERFAALQRELDDRFTASQRELDSRFAALQRELDDRFTASQRELDSRFAALQRELDDRFTAGQRELRELRLEVSALSGRLGYGLERIVQGVLEEFSGQRFSRIERLILVDQAGVLYGVPGAPVEYDLLLSNGTAYVVEVKSHVKPDDVLTFYRKAEFAARELGRPLKKVMIAASLDTRSEPLLRQLDVAIIARSRITDPDRLPPS
jgi:hypothetical protein